MLLVIDRSKWRATAVSKYLPSCLECSATRICCAYFEDVFRSSLGRTRFRPQFPAPRAGIGCCQDRPSHDDEVGARLESLRVESRCAPDRLSLRHAHILGTHARRHNQKFPPARFANRFCFLHRSHHAIHAGLLRQFREFHHARCGAPPIPTSRMAFRSMLVKIVTASNRGRSAPMGTPR